ncbi:chitin-binding protein [Methylocystis bryophila]|uniref:Chitin-binding protein n=1 Tax=Methylocystis bryophila TaxID=655015 RepID=A0A1W6N0Y5_9HYPH|nr:chitin-binding protein [Methylocystis bryophila]
MDSYGPSAQTPAIAVTTASASSSGGGGSSQSAGAINFHLLLGAGSAQDSLTLTGGNYDDLIMSNIIAGVMYAHLVREGYPGVQFNNDYLVGSIFGQLLQENIETQLYQASASSIDPSSLQQAVMGTGQGGPYQINNYAVDLVAGTYAPQGHALINYVAIQKNIGFTIAGAATQYMKPTPASFNNKYYGPMLPAFFHYNDMVALSVTGKGANGWVTPWEPAYDNALQDFISLPNSFLDVILNVAYNQGYYGGLVASYSQRGATGTAATVASVNSYSQVWGSQDSYAQYPYQVHYYLDQLYDNPVPTTGPTVTTTPQNHVIFRMATLAQVFSSVVQTLSYSNGTSPAQFFTASQASAAFSAALTKNAVAPTASLDLSNASSRAVIFAVIDAALSGLEKTVGMKFNATTTSQL